MPALVFASQGEPISDVSVAGSPVIRAGVHVQQQSIGEAFEQAMRELSGRADGD
jgi:hypothetical protein